MTQRGFPRKVLEMIMKGFITLVFLCSDLFWIFPYKLIIVLF